MPMVPDELSGTDWGPYVHISYCGVSVPPNNMGAKNTSAGLKGRRLNGGGGGGELRGITSGGSTSGQQWALSPPPV